MESSVVSRNFFANANTTASATSTSVEWVNIVTKTSSSIQRGSAPAQPVFAGWPWGAAGPMPRPPPAAYLPKWVTP